MLCKACNSEKSDSEFYASERSRCKECVRSRVRANRSLNKDYYRAYDRKRYREFEHRKEAAKRSASTERGKQQRAELNRKRKATEPEKFMARNAVNNALRAGKIDKPETCFMCERPGKLQAHHHDYTHPLDVVWLCSKCHGKLHFMNGDFRRAG
jgi:hypothetical protein